MWLTRTHSVPCWLPWIGFPRTLTGQESGHTWIPAVAMAWGRGKSWGYRAQPVPHHRDWWMWKYRHPWWVRDVSGVSGVPALGPKNGRVLTLHLSAPCFPHLLLVLLGFQAPAPSSLSLRHPHPAGAWLTCLSEARAPEPAQGSPSLLTFHKGHGNRLLPSAERE